MRKTFYFVIGLILFSFMSLYPTVINIPDDQLTIQMGIYAAVDYDTILVQPGIYTENLDYSGMNIVIGSLFLTTQDPAYIEQTVIDGNDNGSVVIFESNEGSDAVLSGFVITNGYSTNWSEAFSGGGICIMDANPSLQNLIIKNNRARYSGGGIYCENASPIISDVTITENSAQTCGGGLSCWYDSSPELNNVTITRNIAERWCGGGILCYYNATLIFNEESPCNIFLNNAPWGTDIYIDSAPANIEVFLITFTVMNPTDYYAYPAANLIFNLDNALMEPVNADLYVSPIGSNSNSGLVPEEPLLSLYFAILKIEADEESPCTIHLANGTYSYSLTEDIMPVLGKDYVTIQGENADTTVLDAEERSGVVCNPAYINYGIMENLTITNGNAQYGGGIYGAYYSSSSFNNLIITNNHAEERGGGIYCEESNYNLSLTNGLICDNTANTGGGIANGFGYPSSISLTNVTIRENYANRGGGIYWEGDDIDFDGESRCNIYSNISTEDVGNDLYFEYIYELEVVVDTFSVLYPTDTQAYPIEDIEFDILHGYAGNLVNADLYVATWGDDSNSGLTPDDPLQTIQYALNRIYADNENQHTIFIEEGVYSSSETGEAFPIEHRSEYVSIYGSENGDTVLDAEMQSSVLSILNVSESTISNLRLIHGNTYHGGGIFMENSDPVLQKNTITHNTADRGGGLYCCKNSDPLIINCTISENTATDEGGGLFHHDTGDITIQNCISWNNTPDEIVSATSTGTEIVNYSDIEGDFTGIGNIDADPLFADALNGDFHLTWLNFPVPDLTKSPCIDTGNPDSSYDPDNTIADMGAYYFNQVQNENDADLCDDTPAISSVKMIYPNPFNPETTIEYEITKFENVKIEVFNIKGQKVDVLINKAQNKGDYSLQWDASGLKSGIYLIKFTGDELQKTQKVVLLK